MAKKVSDSQVAGIKAHAEAKNKETIDKVNKAIDKLKRKNKPINFETVCKEAGVSRATLYNNAQLKERILSLRAISKASPLDDVVAVKKDKIQLKDDKISCIDEYWGDDGYAPQWRQDMKIGGKIHDNPEA